MGRSYRLRPKKLGAKLRLIRHSLELTQLQMIEKLDVTGERLYPTNISAFENNMREPSLLVLLKYARVYGCTIEDLVDDTLQLP